MPGAVLGADLRLPAECCGIVILPNGGGKRRYTRRDLQVSHALNDAGIGTLMVHLLTAAEEQVDRLTDEHRFDVALLARRLLATIACVWRDRAAPLPLEVLGAGTAAADVLVRRLNMRAAQRLPGQRRFAVVPGASRRFDEPGALEEAARLSTDWFSRHRGM